MNKFTSSVVPRGAAPAKKSHVEQHMDTCTTELSMCNKLVYEPLMRILITQMKANLSDTLMHLSYTSGNLQKAATGNHLTFTTRMIDPTMKMTTMKMNTKINKKNI